MRRHLRHLLGFALVAAATAGCGSGSDHALRLTLAALATAPPATQWAPEVGNALSSDAHPAATNCDLEASLRPTVPLPTPGAMPPGSFMEKIKQQGHLIAGVSAGFLHFGYLNPFTGNIGGFEIDLVRALARAIFGNSNPNDVVLEALTADQRIPFVQQGKVDIVVDAFTITCAHRHQVDFSTVYYDAKQRVLVPITSHARGLQDLGGKRVCATEAKGSPPIQFIETYRSHPIPAGARQAIDCLVYLQEGSVDAISTDDAILLGFKAQDPYTKLIGGRLANAPYGMAISKAHPGFVRFVNGVLAQMRADGAWRATYKHWLGSPVPAPPPAFYLG
jgi:polar amino acid transport system substrate-binding protein